MALDTQNTTSIQRIEKLVTLKNTDKTLQLHKSEREGHWRSLTSRMNSTFGQKENLIWFYRVTASYDILGNSVFQQQ